jgi:pectinesterase
MRSKLLALGLITALGSSLLNAQERRREPPAVSERVECLRDIVYARHGERAVQLDLYLPKARSEQPLPCVVVIHGGGWRTGNKERFAKFANRLAEHGFAAACIGYRLLPEVGVQQCIEDCKAAVRWVRANAEKHNLDPQRIGAIGGSAGGHLSAMLATSHKSRELEGTGGNAGLSSQIQAAVCLATPADMSHFRRQAELPAERQRLISPLTHVDAETAPLLLMHSRADRTVPYEQSERLKQKCLEAGVRVELVALDDAPHAFWNSPQGFEDVMTRAIRFFNDTLPKPEKP